MKPKNGWNPKPKSKVFELEEFGYFLYAPDFLVWTPENTNNAKLWFALTVPMYIFSTHYRKEIERVHNCLRCLRHRNSLMLTEEQKWRGCFGQLWASTHRISTLTFKSVERHQNSPVMRQKMHQAISMCIFGWVWSFNVWVVGLHVPCSFMHLELLGSQE
jgi:hypothetical protein